MTTPLFLAEPEGLPPREIRERLGVIAQLLDAAARAVWAEADALDFLDPDAVSRSDLAMGFFLAHAQVAHMLPEGYRIETPPPTQTNPLAMVAAAEELTRDLPVIGPEVQGELGGLAELVAALCDLIRESRSLGY